VRQRWLRADPRVAETRAAEVTFARRIAIGAIAAALVPLVFAALIFANLKEGTRKRQQVLLAQEALVLTGLLERLVIDMEYAE
jgi:hypothetical protein